MLAEDWTRISALIDAALERPEGERDDFLIEQAGDDATLLASARDVLARMGAGDFLEPNSATAFPAPETIPPGQRMGAWLVEGVIAQGGMGAVHAVSRSEGGFEQRGALKIMHANKSVDRSRFEAERQLLADLGHPGIARILDGGIGADGRLWMVMERVDGGPIDQWCEEKGLPLDDRIALAIDVCEAVSQAHRMLVLHRDIKPGNVLVDASGRVRVIDFGIAKQLDISDRTEGVLPISAPYAAPELLTGEPAGPPCDVYGVGALLYELATGKPPIDLDGVPVALGIGRVLEREPKRLTALQAEAPQLSDAPSQLVSDLDAVLAKALRKEADARYPSLDALAEELRRVRDGRAVEARSGEHGYRLRRAMWRARWPIAATAAIVLALTGGLAATLVQKREAIAARDAALAEEARSEAVRQSLYLLLAESVEMSGADAGSRDVLDRATSRIIAQYASEPGGAAPVLHALGELHFYLGDYAAAKAALLPVVTAKAGSVPPDTLAVARYDLAQTLVRMGDIEAAQPLLAAAQAHWRANPDKWRARLIDSRLVEAQVLRANDPKAATALLQTALSEHLALHGRDNRQAGIFYNNIGVALQGLGDLDGAAKALETARGIWQQTGLIETPDALNTANNLAAIETLLGRPQRAEPLFREAVAIRRKLFGASGATAALIANYGKVLLLNGKPDAAQAALAEAAPMAEKFAGAGSMHHVAALAGLSEAQIATGKGDALATARLAVTQAEAGKAPPPGVAMALVALARAQGATGERTAANATLARFDAMLPALGTAGARLAQGAAQVRERYLK
ncbi:MAG: serine/threonine protein kinase [Sphingomonadales bacterium]|jgi:tetratricopeptide (TPR) repeat protein|nr:serine/threonine protein kinase [Sphingomonadales bacterium]MBK9004566.1 serine/threonine protein kinase [Sphingomonadales bacterium]MBP6435146.1 serine/threonine protein kinase [Sphingorhabdus sp.]